MSELVVCGDIARLTLSIKQNIEHRSSSY